MSKQLLFLHGGGGKEDFDADKKLVDSLKSSLGPDYAIHYPLLSNHEKSPDYGRMKQISEAIASSADPLLLVAHSFGASMVLKYFSERKVTKKISGIFLLATPFWAGEEDWVEGFKLLPDFANKLESTIPLFFYHCRDDEEVPFDQFKVYKERLPWATFRDVDEGGHQFSGDLAIVAKDIANL